MALRNPSQKNSLSNLPPHPAGPDGQTPDTLRGENKKLTSEVNGTHLIFVGLAVTAVLLFLLRKMFYILKNSRRRRRRRRSLTACSCRSRECTRLPCPRLR